MTTIAVVSENVGTENAVYRAVAGRKHSQGKTVGEAIDAMNAQLPPEEAGTLVIVQNLLPDRFFSAAQQRRLTELMEQWRTARDTAALFPTELQTELNGLVEIELHAATQRLRQSRPRLSRLGSSRRQSMQGVLLPQ